MFKTTEFMKPAYNSTVFVLLPFPILNFIAFNEAHLKSYFLVSIFDDDDERQLKLPH